MTSESSVVQAVIELRSTFAGEILQPTDSGYEEARRVHNGLVDKRPALIAQCRGFRTIRSLSTSTRSSRSFAPCHRRRGRSCGQRPATRTTMRRQSLCNFPKRFSIS